MHIEWAEQVSEMVGPVTRPVAEDRDPKRVLRVGYLSSDLWNHVCGDCLEGMLRAHNRQKVHVTVFQANKYEDSRTEMLRSLADSWVKVADLRAHEVAERIEGEGLDIVADLNGLTSNTPIEALAYTPAPIQVTMMGYPNTTGFRCIDYRITDAVCDPEDSTQIYSEKLVRLPTFFLCLPRPQLAQVSVGAAPPVVANGFVTFGSFNNLAKHSAGCQRVWGRLLESMPGSQLLIKLMLLREDTQQRWTEEFVKNAVDKTAPGFSFKSAAKMKAKLKILGDMGKYEDHCKRYDEMDVMLDSWPYCGTITTSEALMMGVPVVTLYKPGKDAIHSHNVTASILKQVGLGDLVAATEEEFVQIATNLASNHDRLRELRATLREKCLETFAAPVPHRFCQELEDAYRNMWEHYLDTH
mmetsp:Transcript_42613/g.66747  ORF Transcript_42613/g.66747 Transcript_42613/m.66747 type:complete len:412 (+) Transcript_42613:235-1470(+)